MKASEELKNRIMNQIDSLDESVLEEFYGILTNFIHSKRDINDWESLSENQKKGIIDALTEIEQGRGIPHDQVISDIRQKYPDAK